MLAEKVEIRKKLVYNMPISMLGSVIMKRSAKKRKNPAAEARRMHRREQVLRFLRQNTWLALLAVLVLIALILLICVLAGGRKAPEEEPEVTAEKPYQTAWLCADAPEIAYYDRNFTQSGTVARGGQVTFSTSDMLEHDGKLYYLTYLDVPQYGYICEDNLTDDERTVVREKKVFVRTPQNLRMTEDSIELGELVGQGTELTVLGYDKTANGVVHQYHVRTPRGKTGYISGKYVAADYDEAMEVYDRFGIYMTHASREDRYDGGDGASLYYYPTEKASFADNVMPEHVYAIYLTCDPKILADIDAYIAYAKTTKINAFVVNIIDGTSVGYPSSVYDKYSPTTGKYANNTFEEYQTAIQKIKDAGFYAIGRLTTFNDSFFVTDHPEYGINDTDGEPLYIANSYWPSAFCRYVWEYKVALAKEAVQSMGFNEIQFDYVRFPDGTYQYEKNGNIDYHNTYGETKAQAIQRFLMYAVEELHDVGVYVSADVFGETNNPYVTSYGQYWPAISNVVDVISGMPYPDHFAQNGTYRPWEHPYETLLDWGAKAAERQSETPSPAIVRTWIQAYDAIRTPYNTYGAEEIAGQIRALQENGLDGGFMAWNAMCSLSKLESFKPAFDALE